MKITKKVTEINVLDMEGRRGEWTETNMTYTEAVATMTNPWHNMVREIEKTVDLDTLETTVKEIRRTVKDFEGRWTWGGKTKEIVA